MLADAEENAKKILESARDDAAKAAREYANQVEQKRNELEEMKRQVSAFRVSLLEMYKKHLESFVKKKGMTVKTKATIITSVTLLMGLGFCMMFRVPVGQIILAVVWLCHMVYFLFGVKTIRKEDIEKQYPYVIQLQLEHMEHKKTAKKLVRILNKNEHLKVSFDSSDFVVSIRSEQELNKDELIQTAQQVGCTVKPAETITEKETVST